MGRCCCTCTSELMLPRFIASTAVPEGLPRTLVHRRIFGIIYQTGCKFLSGTGEPTSSGDMLGVVRAPYESVAQPHAPKPAYLAAKSLQAHLRGALYHGRVSANFAKAATTAAAGGESDTVRVDWRGRPLPAGLSASGRPESRTHADMEVSSHLGGDPAGGGEGRMTDPDGISVM
jgi:hypothetical protein